MEFLIKKIKRGLKFIKDNIGKRHLKGHYLIIMSFINYDRVVLYIN